jgi:hypothetical protein
MKTFLSVVDAYDVIMRGDLLTTNTHFWNFPQFSKNKSGGVDKSWPEDIEQTWETKESFVEDNIGEIFRSL